MKEIYIFNICNSFYITEGVISVRVSIHIHKHTQAQLGGGGDE